MKILVQKKKSLSLLFLILLFSMFIAVQPSSAERIESGFSGAYVIESENESTAYSVVYDSQGNYYYTGKHTSGTYSSDMDPTGGVDLVSTTATNGAEIYLTKMNADGTYGYTYFFENQNPNAFNMAYKVEVDSDDNIYIVGQFGAVGGGQVDFDPTSGTDIKTSNSMREPFVTKINADGTYGFTRIFEVSSNAFGSVAHNVAVDSAGNIVVAGELLGANGLTIDLDPGVGTDIRSTAVGAQGIGWMSKLDVNGDYIDGAFYDTTGFSSIRSVKTDGDDNIFLGINSSTSIDYDHTGGANVITGVSASITRINSDFTYAWSYVVDGGSYVTSLAVDSANNVYATGFYSSTIELDPNNIGSQTRVPVGAVESYLLKVNSNDTFGWANSTSGTAGGSGNSITYFNAVDINSTGDVVVAGHFSLAVDFNGGVADDIITSETLNANKFTSLVTRVNSAGTYVDTNTNQGTAGIGIFGMSIGPDDQFIMSGIAYDADPATLDMDPSSGVASLDRTYPTNLLVMRSSEIAYQHIDNLVSGLNAEVSDVSVDNESVDPGILRGNIEATRLYAGSIPLADTTVDYTTDRNWSSVTGDSDVIAGKSFAHNLRSAPGVTQNYTLYVPKLTESVQMGFCPNATSLSEVSSSCPGHLAKQDSDSDLAIENIDGQDFWVMTGVTGSGGYNIIPVDDNGGGTGGSASDNGASNGSTLPLTGISPAILLIVGLGLVFVGSVIFKKFGNRRIYVA